MTDDYGIIEPSACTVIKGQQAIQGDGGGRSGTNNLIFSTSDELAIGEIRSIYLMMIAGGGGGGAGGVNTMNGVHNADRGAWQCGSFC